MTWPGDTATCGDVTLRPGTIDDVARAVPHLDPGSVVAFINLNTLVLMRDWPELGPLLMKTINVVDGWPVGWAASRGGPRVSRSPGPDVMSAVLRTSDLATRHYFYGGSSQAVLDLLLTTIRADHPNVTIAGAEVPPHADNLEGLIPDGLAERLAKADPDILWIGLGSPKQELVAMELAKHATATVMCIGAAFDFLAGEKSRAPRWMNNAGLEWLHRLASEPRRMTMRYARSGVQLTRLVRDRPPSGHAHRSA